MRRGFSIFLILMFALGPLSSLIDGSEDANLPACCRRHGAHHCAMAAMAAQTQTDDAPAVSAPMTCPSYPGSVALLSTPAQALAASSRTCDEIRAFEYVRVAAQTSWLSKPAKTHAGRGPPTSSLS
jgi:hypothetical protein